MGYITPLSECCGFPWLQPKKSRAKNSQQRIQQFQGISMGFTILEFGHENIYGERLTKGFHIWMMR